MVYSSFALAPAPVRIATPKPVAVLVLAVPPARSKALFISMRNARAIIVPHPFE